MKMFLALMLALAVGCGRQVQKDEHDHASHAEQAEEGVVTLAPERVQTVAVETGSAWVTTRFPGRIEYNRDVTATVSTPLEGRLQAWHANIGDVVKEGDVLATVQNPQNLDNPIRIKALIAGRIVERQNVLGAWIKPEDSLFVISELDTLWAVAEVREDKVGKIRVDAPATVRVLPFPDEVFPAKVLRARSEVESEARTVEFWLEVPNADRKLRPGMFAYVALATDHVEDKLLVPDAAVQTVRGESVVFVEEEPGKYRLKEVALGRRLGEQTEVLTGLVAGAKVVTTGAFLLKSEYLRAEMGEGHAH